MTDRDVKKLNRKDLLEMLIDRSREIESLREKLQEAEAALKKRQIAIDKAGSLAEAALLLNGVFESAQNACRQYADNLTRRQTEACRQMEEESRAKAQSMIEEARMQCTAILQDARLRCGGMEPNAAAIAQQLPEKEKAL